MLAQMGQALMEAVVNKKTFKSFLYENGFPFLNVYNNDMETIFGHTKKDLEKTDDEAENVSDEEKTKRKLNAYMRYAKNINEDESNVK